MVRGAGMADGVEYDEGPLDGGPSGRSAMPVRNYSAEAVSVEDSEATAAATDVP